MLSYNELVPRLLEAIPEIAPSCQDAVREWRQTTSESEIDADLVFGTVLVPLIRSRLSSVNSDETIQLLRRVFSFLEVMANTPNAGVQSIVDVSVLEGLLDDDAYKSAIPFMGPSTSGLMQVLLDARKRL